MTGDAKALLELQMTASRIGMYNNYRLWRGKENNKPKTQPAYTSFTFHVLTASASPPTPVHS